MEWKARIIGLSKALRTEMTVKSTCLNKYTDIHDYKTKSFLSLRMLVVFHSSHLLKFTVFHLHQILMEGEDETLCTHIGTFGGGGWRRGESSRNRWWCITDLLDCRGQVQAQLNDFVLCHREIRDPCEWSPRKKQNSLYWGNDDRERNPWASHLRRWHTWLYCGPAYLSWCYFFSTHNIEIWPWEPAHLS